MLNPDFRDMLSALSGTGADFLVVGAYALAAHGMPRATADIDLWVRPNRENAERVMNALRQFGAPLFDLTVDDLSEPGTVFQIGVAPRRIDILTRISGVDFDEAWEDRRIIDFAGVVIPTLSRRHLLQNKQATGRPKDAADIDWLEENALQDEQ